MGQKKNLGYLFAPSNLTPDRSSEAIFQSQADTVSEACLWALCVTFQRFFRPEPRSRGAQIFRREFVWARNLSVFVCTTIPLIKCLALFGLFGACVRVQPSSVDSPKVAVLFACTMPVHSCVLYSAPILSCGSSSTYYRLKCTPSHLSFTFFAFTFDVFKTCNHPKIT
jgi:hypothetical protein